MPAPVAMAGGSNAGEATREKACGGIAGLRCPEKQYCVYAPEAHCGAADMTGTCAPVPEMCTQQVDEVCGCDDKTYSNACMAAQAGVSVVMKGPCQASAKAPELAEGKLCGTRGVPGDCAAGLYCAFKADCGATDAGGICKKKPTMCTKIYMPVCGCDGKTHGSDCTAAAAGVSVAAKGECKKP
ncbi:MAG TPA: Kazal-type serine protease inhibitor domain-containing protein [Polyangiaceae bacterium]|nr:Kazal-type serine protease inhibitor domain-containing protein [Polyangiaceae bacterium]